MHEEFITVEVAYATADKQLIIPINVNSGLDADAAIKASGILNVFPEIDLNVNKIGIFGKFVFLNTPLRHMDRIEIYRPLIADVKKARRERASKVKPK